MGLREFLKGIFTKAIDEIPEDQLPAGGGGRTYSEAEVKAEVRAKEEAAAKKAREEAALEFEEKIRKDKAEAEAKTRKEQVHNFCEALKKEGKLIPAWQKMGVETFMEALAAIPAARKFAETMEEKTPLAWFMDFLAGLPKAVEFKEIAGRGTDPGAGAAAEKLTALTREKMMADKTLTYAAAFSEVQRENVDLAREYLETIAKKN